MTVTRGQSHTELVSNDPDRNLVTVWAVGGGLSTFAYTWTDPDGVTHLTPRAHLPRTIGDGWPLGYYGSARLPDNARPGVWTLDCGRGPEYAFVVTAPTLPRAVTTLQPGASAAAVNAALAAGDVILTPGLYDMGTATIDPPQEARTVTGPGAVVRSASATWAVSSSPNLSVDGVTFEAPNAANGVFAWNPGLVVKNCTFRRCNFGATHATATAIDCRFDGAGMTLAPLGTVLRCRFTGSGSPHAWQLPYSTGRTAMIDCVFDNTDRGPVFNTSWGAVTDCFFIGVRLYNIAGTENGSESFLTEGPNEFSRNLIFTTRANHCRGSCVHFISPAHDNLIWDMQADAPTLLWGDNTGNTFNNGEWRDAYVEFGELAMNNTLGECGVSMFSPHRWNQNGYAPWMYDQPHRAYAVRRINLATGELLTDAAGNAAVNCHLYTGPATLPASGVILTATKAA